YVLSLANPIWAPRPERNAIVYSFSLSLALVAAGFAPCCFHPCATSWRPIESPTSTTSPRFTRWPVCAISTSRGPDSYETFIDSSWWSVSGAGDAAPCDAGEVELHACSAALLRAVGVRAPAHD